MTKESETQRLDSYENSRRMVSDELLDAFLERDRAPGA